MTDIEEKSTCKQCNISYPATNEFFKVINGIIRLKQQCKNCKREKQKEYEKNKRPKRISSSKEYMKEYNKLRSEKMKIYDAERRRKKKEAKLLLLSLDENKTD